MPVVSLAGRLLLSLAPGGDSGAGGDDDEDGGGAATVTDWGLEEWWQNTMIEKWDVGGKRLSRVKKM